MSYQNNEQAYEAGKSDAKQRLKAILTSPEADANPDLAHVVAFETDMTADVAIKYLNIAIEAEAKQEASLIPTIAERAQGQEQIGGAFPHAMQTQHGPFGRHLDQLKSDHQRTQGSAPT